MKSGWLVRWIASGVQVNAAVIWVFKWTSTFCLGKDDTSTLVAGLSVGDDVQLQSIGIG